MRAEAGVVGDVLLEQLPGPIPVVTLDISHIADAEVIVDVLERHMLPGRVLLSRFGRPLAWLRVEPEDDGLYREVRFWTRSESAGRRDAEQAQTYRLKDAMRGVLAARGFECLGGGVEWVDFVRADLH